MVTKMVNVTINGIHTEVPSDYTILEAANKLNIFIPRLCFLKGINENAACRVCVVEIKGMRTLKNSCSVKVWDGIEVITNSERVNKAVVQTLQLIAADHRFDCWKCSRENNCELLALLRRYEIDNKMGDDTNFAKKPRMVNTSCAITFDSSKCILCGRCIGACDKLAGTHVLNFNERGFITYVGTALNHDIEDAGCIYCGKCIGACPTGAIREKEEIDDVFDALNNPELHVVAQVAPAVRSAIAEEFGNPIGTNGEGRMYEALRVLGFDDITDVNFAADVTIMEEGTEFLGRINKFLNGEKVALPLLTSCSPGWIRYIERYYPEYLENLSTTKSPQQIQGALIKHYYAKKIGVDPSKIYVVSVMPCIAKKYEAKRPEMESDGLRDVDAVITTRELGRMIKRRGINFNTLPEYLPTSPLAKYTGAGVIFGTTGGVMEAALRTVVHILDPKNEDNYDLTGVRGVNNGIKEATITINGLDVNVAVVHGAVNIPEMFARIKEGKKQYHFIEVMGCTGGCVNGGGQPIVNAVTQENCDVRALRAGVLYNIDKKAMLHKSHENKEVQKLYAEYLESPNSHEAHRILHTTYSPKGVYKEIK